MIRFLLLLLLSSAAQAHQASEAYLSYRVDGAEVEQRLDIVGSSRVDLQACKLEYSIVSPK